MAVYEVEYILTERTVRVIEVEADSPEDALAAVEGYEVDFSESVQVDSLEWSISGAEVL